MSLLAGEIETVRRAQAARVVGKVSELRGLSVLVDELPAPVGSLVSIRSAGLRPIAGEVVGFTGSRSIVMPLSQAIGICPSDRVLVEEREQFVRVSDGMLGRVLDGLAQPIDGLGAIRGGTPRLLNPEPRQAMRRARVDHPIRTGVRAIDLMTPLGRGQRMGIFAGPGVGKSTLLAEIARGTDAEVNVIALIGERGREVREFIEDALGPKGLERSIVVVATSDQSPPLRLRAARLACSIAEHFRDQGRHVMLMMDSVTRFAHAQRQVGLSAGEPPATRGYTPSVFANLAHMLERAGGCTECGGSITGLYTILVEGDDMTEPVADAARGILDGHLVLSRKLAHRAHYPAIDVLDSVSRVADSVIDNAHLNARRQLLRLEAKYRQIEDLVQIGAYARGADPEADVAVAMHEAIERLLRQGVDQRVRFEDARASLIRLAEEATQLYEQLAQSGTPNQGQGGGG
ncbi:MAG: FliI/YscN family ATPase [Planctomycetota bacterium]|nr:MAG: FliI/YscN family ATPase [Planctomycetota bacterium]